MSNAFLQNYNFQNPITPSPPSETDKAPADLPNKVPPPVISNNPSYPNWPPPVPTHPPNHTPATHPPLFGNPGNPVNQQTTTTTKRTTRRTTTWATRPPAGGGITTNKPQQTTSEFSKIFDTFWKI